MDSEHQEKVFQESSWYRRKEYTPNEIMMTVHTFYEEIIGRIKDSNKIIVTVQLRRIFLFSEPYIMSSF